MTIAEQDWSAWLNEHGPALVLFARQWSRDRGQAEDVVQDAFIRFWRSRDQARDPRAYLFSCVKSAALDARRGDQRRVRREQAGARGEAVSDQVAAAVETMFPDGPIGPARRDAIQEAMNELPDEQREVLVMKVWGGLTFPQIGAALSISPNTAASRYRYGLESLRRRLPEPEES